MPLDTCHLLHRYRHHRKNILVQYLVEVLYLRVAEH